jgi:excinuclease ABC subunit B
VEPDTKQAIAADPVVQYMSRPALEKAIAKTKKAMQDAAKKLDFLDAAQLRDELIKLEDLLKTKQ